MSSSAKTLLTAATWILLAVGLISGAMLPVSAGGNDCGTVFFPREPLLSSPVIEAACSDARSSRLPLVWLPILIGVGLGVWRLGQSNRGVRQPDQTDG